MSSIPGSGRFPGGRNGTSVILSVRLHGQRSLAVNSPWGRKESDTTEHKHAILSVPQILNKFIGKCQRDFKMIKKGNFTFERKFSHHQDEKYNLSKNFHIRTFQLKNPGFAEGLG